MEEIHKELLEMLQSFEDGDIGFYELGDWISTNGYEIAEALSI